MSDKFLLDANVFIEARDRYYAYDICPGFWPALIQAHTAKHVFSLDRIHGELVPKKKDEWDDIARWINEKVPTTFFKRTEDQVVIDLSQNLVNWVYSQPQFMDSAKAEFATVADGWLVAYAVTNGLTVVTQEVYAPTAKKSVPVPNLCEEFDVDYVNTFAMLRSLKVKFIRATKR